MISLANYCRLTATCAMSAVVLCLSGLSHQALAAGFTADKHLSKGLPCTACHQQASGGNDVERDTCLKCHAEADLKVRGEAIKPRFNGLNPHAPHFEDLSCTECHQGHREDKNFCSGCHSK